MAFSSVSFLFYFLPGVVVCYALATARWRNLVLLGASVVFYLWGSGVLISLLAISIVVDYFAGILAARGVARDNQGLKRLAVTMSVVTNVALLAVFKYGTWLIETVSDLGLSTGSIPEITVPIGIAFFTFHSMSYTIDVARGRCDHVANPLDLALYVAAFPRMIAGPIVRYHEIESQLHQRLLTTARFGQGAVRFSHGLVKKVVIADTVAPIADAAFASDDLTMTAAWIGALAYTMQIYFDFSGYADMAIGLGHMFGFTFPENFDRPYSAVSVTDFWRRWHITLSNWFRDYVFIPLGGSRGTATAVYRNLMIVFLLTGLWHGANWTFAVWGAYHGSWLLIERRFHWRLTAATGRRALRRRTSTFLIVVIGWVIFRAESIADALEYLGAMVVPDGFGVGRLARVTTTRATVTLAIASLVVLLPARFTTGPIVAKYDNRPLRLARVVLMVALLPFALLLVASGAFSPFLYLQF